MNCTKCGAVSGDDWEQCGGSCPQPASPHFNPQAAEAPAVTRNDRLQHVQEVLTDILLECPEDEFWENFDPEVDELRTMVLDIIEAQPL